MIELKFEENYNESMQSKLANEKTIGQIGL